MSLIQSKPIHPRHVLPACPSGSQVIQRRRGLFTPPSLAINWDVQDRRTLLPLNQKRKVGEMDNEALYQMELDRLGELLMEEANDTILKIVEEGL